VVVKAGEYLFINSGQPQEKINSADILELLAMNKSASEKKMPRPGKWQEFFHSRS